MAVVETVATGETGWKLLCQMEEESFWWVTKNYIVDNSCS